MIELKDWDAARDLVVTRDIAAPVEVMWRCWTEADLLKRWYCPRPWQVTEADLDPRPGGRSNMVMQGPDGTRIDLRGSYLEVVPYRRLVFTDAYTEGFRPVPDSFMTGFVRFEPAADGMENSRTRVTWGARHMTAEAAEKHREMGFEPGWNAALDQLDELAREVAAAPQPTSRFGARARTCLFLASEAAAAAAFYTSLLPDSGIDAVHRPDPDGPALVVEFTIAGAPYMALNGNPDVVPSHLTSISVLTVDQAETDRLWDRLTAEGGEPGRCGWLKDRFGVHWQIVPQVLPRLMRAGDPAAASRVRAALMTMSRIEIAGLERAFAGTAGAA